MRKDSLRCKRTMIMAGSEYSGARIDMARNVFCSVLFSLYVLECLFGLVKAVEEHRQAFIQTDNELRYLVDGISLHSHEGLLSESDFSIPSSEDVDINAYSSPVTFFPPVLDFKEHPVGMPHQVRVVVSNPNYHINVFLLSISGSTVHFHCSFFQDKVIPPGGNTTFKVVFLSRQEGPVHNTLYIHTSVGSFKYQVYGVGTPNPYRLRPFVGARVPVNSIYSPVINMYNPHSSTLQVTEMYSSGGDLHLELTSGEKEAPRKIWEIPPYETKSVMKASFVARVENNHTIYICIKTNRSNNVDLILPVEVEVTSAPGIYATTDSLEFGVMYSKDKARKLELHLLNHGQKPVQIVSVSVSPTNNAVSVDFRSVKVPPDTTYPTQVATVVFHPQKSVGPSQVSGKIIVRTKTREYKLIIPYHATVLRGTLDFNSSATEFYVGESRTEDKLRQTITLKNTFDVSVAIFHIELPTEAKKHFKVFLQENVVIHPNQTLSVGLIKLKNYTSSARLNTYFRLHTNISRFDVPLRCYNGKLSKFIPLARNSSVLEIGALSLGENRDIRFAIINNNPVNVNIRRFGASMVHMVVELLAVHNGNLSDVIQMQNFIGMNKSLVLKPFQFAIFRIGISAPTVEDNFRGELFVETQFENLRIPFSFKTANGFLAVTPPKLSFESAFPGKITVAHLYIQSTFSQPMTVTSVTPLMKDDRFFYHAPKGSPPVLQPNAKTHVGKLNFDVRKECRDECYSGFDLSTASGRQWQLGLKLLSDVVMVDIELYQRFRSRWSEVLSSEKKWQNITFVIDTSEVRGFLVEAQASLTWPNLALKPKLSFPLTQIGNSTMRDLYLENPSSDPVAVQLVPLSLYPNPEAVVNALRESGVGTLNKEAVFGESKTFVMHEPVCTKSQVINKSTGVIPHADTIVIHMEPGGKARVPIHFIPHNDQQQLSMLVIRNNLTVLEAVVLKGNGAHGQLSFGNRDSNVSHPLQFKLTEKHLQSCDSSRQSQYTLPNFTVRRVFTIYNTGALPVYVRDFDINGSPCEGYGFRILYCYGFLLNANSSRKIDIAFTPDFTLSRVQRILNIHTSLWNDGGILNFSLVATIPPHLLSRCAAVIPRPLWEAMIYYLVVSLVIFLLFCTIVAAYLESDRVIRRTFLAMTVTAIPSGEYAATTSGNRPPPDYGKVFDLKSIAAKVNYRSGGRQPSPTLMETPNGNTDVARGRRHQSGGTCPNSAFQNNNNSTINLLKSQNLRTLLNGHNGMGSGSPKGQEAHSTKEKELRGRGDCDTTKNNKKKSRKKSLSSDSSSLTQTEKSRLPPQKAWNNAEPPAPSLGLSSCKGVKGSKKFSNANNNSIVHPNNSSSCNNNPESDKLCSNNNIEATQMWIKNDIQGTNNKNETLDDATVNKKNHKKAQVPVYHLTEEETSSTTTESSNPDVDSSEREQKRDPKSNKQKVKWTKTGSGSRTGTDSSKVDEADDEGDFEVNTKSRSRKPRDYHKGNHTEFSPSTLELPYKPKPTTNRIYNTKDACYHREGLQGKLRQPKKPSTFKLRTAHQRTVNDTESSSTGKDSPPPEWDHPKPASNTDDAYNELASQTENFAMKLGQTTFLSHDKSSVNRKFKLNDNFLDGRHSESNRVPRAKVLPVGKIAPEPKQMEPKLFGPVGQKPPSFKSLQLPIPSCNPISAAGFTSPISGTPSTPDGLGPYYLPPILDCDQTSANNLPLSAALFGASQTFYDGNSWRMPLENHSVLDDKCRQTSYDGANWLNFAPGSTLSENLWEGNLNGEWLGVKDAVENSSSMQTEDYWGDPKHSRSSFAWQAMSPWSASNANISSNQTMNTSDQTSQFEKIEREEQTFSAPGFDPFSALPNIWTPPGSGHISNESSGAPNGWSNSFFTPSPTSLSKDN